MAGLTPVIVFCLLALYTIGTPIDRPHQNTDAANVTRQCPGMHTSWCPSHNKCCATKHLHWEHMCCPHEDGVCCGEDSEHCCREHETCTQWGCHYDGDEHINGIPLSNPFLRMIKNTKPVTSDEDNSISLATPQQKKVDLLNEVTADYPRCGKRALCTGNMCCPINNKEGIPLGYTCCPYLSKNARCCETWCCDEGFKCGDPDNQTCIKIQDELVDVTPSELNIKSQCSPELNDTCTNEQTCCVTPDKHFTCAPFANATCCKDGIHSCPQGYKCDCETNVCSPNEPAEEQTDKKVIRCDSKMECHENQTCCTLTDGTFGCCPFENAVCCSDHIHCCPENMECDQTSHTCVYPAGEKRLVMLHKISGKGPNDVECKDGSLCPEKMTCCSIGDNKFGCCPFEMATCCSDLEHCCPEGMECDIDLGTCVTKDNEVIPMAKISLASKQSHGSGNIICDDEMECRDDQTCCKLTDGTYGCCPFEHAVCCSDHIHCCPHDMWCNHTTHTCKHPGEEKKEDSIPMAKKVPATKQSPVSIGTQFPAKKTTTQPSQNAVPIGVKFQANQTEAIIKPNSIPMMKKFPAKQPKLVSPSINKNAGDVVRISKTSNTLSKWVPTSIATSTTKDTDLVECPDGRSYCPKLSDCCKILDGSYGCCPAKTTCCDTGEGCHGCCPDPYNICCNNGEWCCGNGTVCDLKNKSCRPKGSTLCADGSYCDKPDTCCSLEDSSYTCCPEKTMCCNGGKGCCPDGWGECCNGGEWCCQDGTLCDIPNEGCKYAGPEDHLIGLSAPVYKKNVARPQVDRVNVTYVKCEDRSECPDGTTCCKLPSGKWGCCPLSNAVCCSDGIHCCPQGTTCDVSAGACIRANTQLQDLTEPLVAVDIVDVTYVTCDDGSECPDSTTCCKLSSGQWGCCPFPNAVCCSDKIHCCPHGYTCDVSAGACNRANTPLQELTELIVAVDRMDVTCDDGSECPSGTTCCTLSSGQWGCCPYPNAVCCNDGEHCCPEGYTCDVSAGKCNRANTPLQELTELIVAVDRVDVTSVKCDDGSECPSGTTCCKLSSGQWGCCPWPNAVCCNDGEHCCPEGYTCHVSAGKCDRDNTQLQANQCPDKSICPTSATCCNISQTTYACCPYKSAVCCEDGLHCCPAGWQCDIAHRHCVQKSTGRFLPIPKLDINTQEYIPRCNELKSCGDAGHCPLNMECLNMFGMCYSLENLGHQKMITCQ